MNDDKKNIMNFETIEYNIEITNNTIENLMKIVNSWSFINQEETNEIR